LHKTLVDQKPPAAPIPESLLEVNYSHCSHITLDILQIEKTLDLYSLIEDDPVNQMTLDMEEKNLTRRVRITTLLEFKQCFVFRFDYVSGSQRNGNVSYLKVYSAFIVLNNKLYIFYDT
jgi:hypothetical protein